MVVPQRRLKRRILGLRIEIQGMRRAYRQSLFLSSLLASAFNGSPFPPPELPSFSGTTSFFAIPVSPAGLSRAASCSTNFGLPRNRGGSAPALVFSRPAQRLLSLRPACSPSRLCDLLHRRLQQLRCLRRCFDCYRVERTSSRTGFLSAEDQRLSTAHPVEKLK